MPIASESAAAFAAEGPTMAKPIVRDELWELVAEVIPEHAPSPKGGRFRINDRAALTGILFVLRTGIPWEDLPVEMGCGSGMTCWRRLRHWQADGTWDRIHKILLDRLRGADTIAWSRAIIDSSSVRAAHSGTSTGPSPGDRAKAGSKLHVIVDANGIPLAAGVTAANAHDVTEFGPLFRKLPAVAGKVGRPRRRPDAMQGDRAYDSELHRAALRQMGIEPVLARRCEEHGSGLGVYRWVVERTMAWLHQNRRLRVRYERRPDIHQALLTLA
jgi:transposase